MPGGRNFGGEGLLDPSGPASSEDILGGVLVETARRATSPQGSRVLKVAGRIASPASDQANQNRRMNVRAVDRATRKCTRAIDGTSGALSPSRASTARPKR